MHWCVDAGTRLWQTARKDAHSYSGPRHSLWSFCFQLCHTLCSELGVPPELIQFRRRGLFLNVILGFLQGSDCTTEISLGAVMPKYTASPTTLVTVIWISSPIRRHCLGFLVMTSNGYPFWFLTHVKVNISDGQ
jgi:hypothetical protein